MQSVVTHSTKIGAEALQDQKCQERSSAEIRYVEATQTATSMMFDSRFSFLTPRDQSSAAGAIARFSSVLKEPKVGACRQIGTLSFSVTEFRGSDGPVR